jgi:hypothetical protein
MGPALYGAIDVEGRPRSGDGTGGSVVWRSVTPRYFSALGIPILRGRGFTEQDRDPDSTVVILSDTLARRMFPGEDPLLKRIRPGRNGPWLTVIGVAANVKNSGLASRDDPEYYLVRKHAPANVARAATAIVRGPADPAAVRAAFGRTLPVEIERLDARVARLAARPRFNALLLGVFASMGLLLAAIGLYGVISFLVAQRTREIGVRMALGATPFAIAGLVMKRAALSTAAGALLGVAGSLAAGQLLRGMLFRIPARDPWTLAGALAILTAAALTAAWIPSRRAARTDPMRALRQE